MKFLFRLSASLILMWSVTCSHAQMPGASTGFNTALIKLFGKHDNFSLTAELQTLENKKPSMTVVFPIEVREGKMRVDVDLANITGPMMTPEIKSQMKSMGMDKVTSIIRPGQMLLAYPGIQSYADVPLPKEDALNIKKTPLARETVDGHPCVKNRVLMSDAKGRQQEVVVWEATDLKDFPIMLSMVESGQNMVLKYRQIRFVKPDASRFEAPLGYARYTDVVQMFSRARK